MTESPTRTNFNEVAPSRVRHAMATADAIAHTINCCHVGGVEILRSLGDGRLVLEVGEHRQLPDFHFQLRKAGKTFNLVFEIDNATEPIDSKREQSIRSKILGYETYQNWVLGLWSKSGRVGPRPSFRVVFLTIGADRANHMLWLAHELAYTKDRRLVYATTQDNYLGDMLAVTHPIFNDHLGDWQSLVNYQATSGFLRERVRLKRPIARIEMLCLTWDKMSIAMSSRSGLFMLRHDRINVLISSVEFGLNKIYSTRTCRRDTRSGFVDLSRRLRMLENLATSL